MKINGGICKSIAKVNVQGKGIAVHKENFPINLC